MSEPRASQWFQRIDATASVLSEMLLLLLLLLQMVMVMISMTTMTVVVVVMMKMMAGGWRAMRRESHGWLVAPSFCCRRCGQSRYCRHRRHRDDGEVALTGEPRT